MSRILQRRACVGECLAEDLLCLLIVLAMHLSRSDLQLHDHPSYSLCQGIMQFACYALALGQIGEAPDVEPASRRMRFKMNTYAKQDKKQQEAAHANQQRRSSTFEHDYRAKCQHQIEIQCEVRLLQHPLYYCNEQTLEQEIEPKEPGLHTLRKPTPKKKAIYGAERRKDEGR